MCNINEIIQIITNWIINTSITLSIINLDTLYVIVVKWWKMHSLVSNSIIS